MKTPHQGDAFPSRYAVSNAQIDMRYLTSLVVSFAVGRKPFSRATMGGAYLASHFAVGSSFFRSKSIFVRGVLPAQVLHDSVLLND